MADKKEIKKTPAKSTEKEEKVSPEEIKKRKEEVLARIDAEIGESSSDEVVIDEKTDEEITKAEEPTKDESKESFEKEMVDEDVNTESKNEKSEKPDETNEMKKEPEPVSESDNEDTKQEKEDGRSTFSAAEFGLADRRSNKGKNIILFIVVFLLVAVISALFYLFATGTLKLEQKEEKEAVPTEAPTATPTPVEFDRAQFSVQVLNGSGESGVAGAMETYLADLGYETIEVGNADDSDYLNVTIQIKEEFKEYAKFLSDDLSDSYTVNEDFETLDNDSEYDVVIIVGSDEEETEEDAEIETEEADE